MVEVFELERRLEAIENRMQAGEQSLVVHTLAQNMSRTLTQIMCAIRQICAKIALANRSHQGSSMTRLFGPLTRHEVMLAALASGAHEEFSPVQIQKLMFLIDKNIGRSVGGPYYDFRPYHYGPFDASVYGDFATLAGFDLGEIEGSGRDRRYRLNDEGRARAREALEKLPEEYQQYISSVANFVQRLPFTALVSAIYKRYPEMKANSIFRT